jgi:hypothetical protein
MNVLERSRTFVVHYRSRTFAIVPDRFFLLKKFFLSRIKKLIILFIVKKTFLINAVVVVEDFKTISKDDFKS